MLVVTVYKIYGERESELKREKEGFLFVMTLTVVKNM
jgi:hypothetical protein